jgi:hypothetical protein
MRKFIIRTTYFFVIPLIIAFPLDIFISNQLINSNERIYQQWSELYHDKISSDVIVLGNSRAWVQYNPMILDSILETNSYILGLDGSPINRQIIKYNYYREHSNIPPKVVIQNIDFMTMDIRSGYEREQFFPFFIYDRKLVYSFQTYENFNLFELYIPCYRYIGYQDEIKKAFRLYPKEISLNKGFFAYDKRYDGSELRKMKNITAKIDNTMIVEFSKFCAEIKSDSIDMCFVYAPVYIEATNKLVNKDDMYKTYQTIANKYNIPILDYNYHSISYDSTNFYNATHLNKKGSILFSTQLAHDLDSLGILQK